MDSGWRQNKKTGGWFNINDIDGTSKISTNKYMNDYIRNKGKQTLIEKYNNNKQKFEKMFNDDDTTARTKFYEQKGFDGKPKVVDENEFEKIQDKNNPVMQRATSEKSYDSLVNGEYRVSSPQNSIYGTGIYFAYGEDDKKYYAGLANTQKVFEARVDKTAKMIHINELEKMKNEIRNELGSNIKRIDTIILADNGVVSAFLGYDGVYFDNVGYGLVLNRSKLIIKR